MKHICMKLIVISLSAIYMFAIRAGAVPQAVESLETANEIYVEANVVTTEDDGYLLAETSGSCGKTLTWTLGDDGTLTVSGTGTMYTWRRANLVPWYSSRNLIKKVVIEDGCTTVGKFAFHSCKNLEAVTLPDGITGILNEAFYDCKSLAEITLPATVTSIGNDSFNGCTVLSAITVPDSVTKLGTNAFSDCSSVTEINIKGVTGNIPEGLFSGCSALKTVTISDGITSIGASAFNGCAKLTGFEIPAGVTSIGESAFKGCAKLTQAVIPAGITEIYDYTFDGCSRLSTLTLPEGLLHIGHRAFAECAWLDEITLPDTLISIGKMAFYGCTYLESITIPDTVKSIGEGAFRDCNYATALYIGKGVEYIAPYAFYSCDRITFITVNSENSYYVNDENGVLYNKDKTILVQYPCRRPGTEYIVPDFVDRIESGAFASSYYLRSVEIPEGIKTIGVSAFSGCSNLAGVKLPESIMGIGKEFIDSTCTIYTYENTYAHSFAAYYGHNYYILDGNIILPSRVYLNTNYISVRIGGTPFTLTASVAPHFKGYTTIDEIEWRTDNESVLSVEGGIVTGLTKGTTYVYAMCADKYARTTVSVIQSVTGIELSDERVTMLPNETFTVTATVIPENANYKYVYWSTSDSSIATVSSGKITANGLGNATITARTHDGSYKAYVEVTVVEYIPGELNGDRVVDMNDAILLLQHSMFPSLYPIEYKGSLDFNGDGVIDMNDAILLLQYSMFPDLYPIS